VNEYLDDAAKNRALEVGFFNGAVRTEANAWAKAVITDYRRLEKELQQVKAHAWDCCDPEMMIELEERLNDL